MVEILLRTRKIECGVSPREESGGKNTETLSVANTTIAERNQRMIAEAKPIPWISFADGFEVYQKMVG